MSFPSSSDVARANAVRAIHLDLVGGLAGDMFVAAMLDALPDLVAPVFDDCEAVRPAGAARPALIEAVSGGLRARRFALDPAHVPSHAHETHHGTRYTALRDQLARAALPDDTRRHALALLATLGEAEARVHGTTLDAVHFHELADWDSLLDVVAAGAIVARLPGCRFTASRLPIGGGTVKTAHGRLPVPAPATAVLLEGYMWHDDGIPGERVTPTGAAILRHLVAPDDCGSGLPGGRLVGVGLGAGTRELPGLPNVARAMAFATVERTTGIDDVAIIEFDVDDMTGEEVALGAERLRAFDGVIDVTLGTRHGKKGRPVVDFRVMARPDATDSVAARCFAETSTLGLRVREERRRVLPRDEPSRDEAVRVKVAQRQGGARTAKAAHDDVASLPTLDERRRAREAAERRALGEEPT